MAWGRSYIFGSTTAVPVVRLVAIGGDSNSVGRGTFTRGAGDVDVAGVYQFINHGGGDPGGAVAGNGTISSDITPLYHPDNITDRLGPGEQLGRDLKVRYPNDVILLIPCGLGGQSLTPADARWRPDSSSPTSYTRLKTSITAAEAAAAIEWPTYELVRELVYFDGGANDVAISASGADFHAAHVTLIGTFRSEMTDWASTRWVLAGLPYDDIVVATGQAVERAMLRSVANISGVYYVKCIDDVVVDGDAIHRDHASNVDLGGRAALIDTDTTPPVWTGDAHYYNADDYTLAVTFTGDTVTVYGSDTAGVAALDADSEVSGLYGSTYTLRWLSDGTKGTGTYTPDLTLIGGNRVTLTPSITIEVVDGASFDISLLIPSGVWGYNFDPALLTTANQSQDTGGATPVVVDAVVGRVVDDGPNAVTIEQATAANKPLLRLDGGVYCWEGDGTNDRLEGTIAAPDGFGAAMKFTVVALVKAAAVTSRVAVAEGQNSTNIPFVQSIVTGGAGDNDQATSVIRNDTSGIGSLPSVDSAFDSTWKIISVQWAGPGALGVLQTYQLRVNGGSWDTENNNNAGPITCDRIALFSTATGSGASFFPGKIGGVEGIAEFSREGLLAIIEQNYAARAGITL